MSQASYQQPFMRQNCSSFGPCIPGDFTQQDYFNRSTQYPPTMTRERLVKFKTELCNYYTNKQICPFYSSCSFAHGEGERRRNPVSPFTVDYKPEPCKEGTKDINYCLNNNELYYHPENYKTQYCKTVTQGEMCNRPLCAMAHTAAELKSKPNTNTLAYLARYQHWGKLRDKLDKPEDSAAINPHSSYNFTRETVLHYVAKYGLADLCKRLIELGANVNSKDWKDQTPLHKLAAFGGGDAAATARILLEAGANKNALDTDGATPSSFASKSNQPQLLELLSSWGPDEGGSLGDTTDLNHFPTFYHPRQPSYAEPVQISAIISSSNGEENEHVEPPLKRQKVDTNSDPSKTIHQVKLKCDTKLKMVKIYRTTGLIGLCALIKQKFNMDTPYILYYQDMEGDTINLDDDDDLEIFLDSTDAKKIIQIQPGTTGQPQE